MHEAQWANILDRIAERFEIVERGDEALEGVPHGRVDFAVFDGPLGRVRLECVTKPRTIGERAVTSRRIGGETSIEVEYDFDDLVRFLRAKRLDERTGSWVAIDATAFS